MPDYRSMFDREYIGAWDLPPGRDAVVVIREVKGAELTAQGGRKAKKPVVYFEGKDKGFVLNKTNGRAIAGMYGPKTEAWTGKPIALFVASVAFGAETVEAIRVRPTPPTGKADA